MLGRRIVALCSAIIALGGVAAVSAGAGTGPDVVTASAPAAAATYGSATYGSSVGFNGTQAMYLAPAAMNRMLDGIAASGSHWLRVDFPWSSIAFAGRGRYSWDAPDRMVAAANARGIHLLAMVAYTPSWNRPAGTTDHYQPTDPTAFAEFVRAAAQRYGPQGLHAWEIWNEPNMRDFWQPVPNVARYTQLLRLGSAAIHSVDPAAYVVSAGVAPAVNSSGYSIAPNDFVSGMYANGAGPYIQAVGVHPYSFPYVPTYPAQWNTFYTTPQVHAIMAAHGDGAKPIWGTEIGWGTGTGQKAVSESQQAAMVGQMISAWGRYSFAGNLFWYNWQDLSSDRRNVFENMGVLRKDGSAKPALAAFRALLHSPAPHTAGAPNAPWLIAADARIFATGSSAAPARGGLPLNRPITGSARTPSGRGLWMVAGDGGIFSFGDAAFFGSTGGMHLNRPIVGMAPTRSGRGYWLVASDGGVFSFGDASFYGSTGAIHLNKPIVGMATTPSGGGYWMVASDGGIFSFGDASFYGSTGAMHLNRPIVGIARSHSGDGYWTVASDGGMFTFGDARFFGSTAGAALSAPVVGVAPTTSGKGYWIATAGGTVYNFGDAAAANSAARVQIVTAV